MSAEDFAAIKAESKARRQSLRERNMAEAINKDDGGWVKRSKWHWQRMHNGVLLNYWPSTQKYMLDGWKRARSGCPYKFMGVHTRAPEHPPGRIEVDGQRYEDHPDVHRLLKEVYFWKSLCAGIIATIAVLTLIISLPMWRG